MRIISWLLLFGFIFLENTCSFAQKVEFEHLQEKGMVSSNVTSIIKDFQGYMWFGTYQGLSRFDGYSFTNYINDPLDSTSLTHNSIRKLYETKSHLLLIATYNQGICVFDRNTDSFHRFRHDPKNKSSLRNDLVFTIFEDHQGNIWVGTMEGLEKFNYQTKSFTHYQIYPNGNHSVSSIAEDEEHNLWIYGQGRKLCKFNPVTSAMEYFDFATMYENANVFFGGVILLDSKKNLWIGENALFRFNSHTKQITTYPLEKNTGSHTIHSIIEDAEKNIWFGSDGNGVFKYSYLSDSLEHFVHDPEDPTSLSNNGIYSIYESEPGMIWVGIYAGGVNIYKKHKKKFQSITTEGKDGYHLNQKSIFSIESDGNGKIYLGTDGGGLNVFDPKTGKINFLTIDNCDIHSNIIKSMALDDHHNLWLGSYGKGLCKINFKKKESFTFTIGKDSLKTIFNPNVWSLLPGSDGRIYIGLLGSGLQIYDTLSKTFEFHPYDPLGFKKKFSTISVIFEDHSKRIWLGSSDSGLGVYDADTKTITYFLHDNANPNSISSDKITGIFEDRKNNIWVSTQFSGLNKLEKGKTNSFKHYTINEGLPSNSIRSILEDAHDNLWISTDNGISVFKPTEEEFINFNREDGLKNLEFNYPSKYKDPSGCLYFGGINGLTFFHPDSIKFNAHIPPVVLTDFKIFAQSLKPFKKYEERTYLKKMLSLSDHITLYPQDNIFSIEFAALDYIAPAINKYAYQLEGFNNKWTYVNADKRIATYTNLDPGEYIFKVIACNNDGLWNKNGTSLKITILPPWWNTWWFKILVILFCIIALAAFYYIRMRRIHTQNVLLGMEVKNRTLELEKNQQELEHSNKTKDKFFSIIGHDLKGPVSAMNFLTNMLKYDWQTLEKEMNQEDVAVFFETNQFKKSMAGLKQSINHLDKSSMQVKNLVLSLLEWARTQAGQVKLQPQTCEVPKIFSDTIHLLQEQANQKQITFQIKTQEGHQVFGDYNMLCTVVRNIVGNSIKFTPMGGNIILSSQISHDNQMEISIRDNGTGMSDAILQKLFTIDKGTSKVSGTGLGLVICYEFIQLHHGSIRAESMPGKGSTFFILLPIVAV